jgi:LPS-assembly lipoprotein
MKPVLCLLCLLLTAGGCGFHLRGEGPDLRPAVSDVYLDAAPDSVVARELRARLQDAGVRIDPDGDRDRFTIRVGPEALSNEVLSVSPQTGKAEEYLLVMTIPLTVIAPDGTALADAETVTVTRDYTLEEEAVLSDFREREVIQNELRSEAAARIVRRFSALVRSR